MRCFNAVRAVFDTALIGQILDSLTNKKNHRSETAAAVHGKPGDSNNRGNTIDIGYSLI